MSDIYNIENTDDNETAINDTLIIDALLSLEERVIETGTISKSDVLSLEELIGIPLITDELPINSFTETGTHMGSNELLVHLGKLKQRMVINEVCTRDDLSVLLSECRILVSNLEGRIEHGLSDVDETSVLRLANEKITMYHNNDDKLVSVLDLPIIGVIERHYTYLDKVIGSENIDDIINRRQGDDLLLFMCAVKQNKLDSYNLRNVLVEDITLRDFINIYENINLFLSKVKDFKKDVLSDILDIEDSSWAIYSNKDLARYIKRYTMIKSYLSDRLSVELITKLANTIKI